MIFKDGARPIRTIDDWDVMCQRWGFSRVGKVQSKYGTIYINEKREAGKPTAEHPAEQQTHYRVLWAIESRVNGVGVMDLAREIDLSAMHFLNVADRVKVAVADAEKGFMTRSAKAGRYGGN